MPKPSDMLQIKRILFPLDFSEQTYATAPFVGAMASRFGAQLILLSVVPGESALTDAAPLMEDLEPRMDGVFRKAFAHLDVKRIVELGEPAEVIARFADTQGVDIIMMPTHGYGPLRRLLLGSVTAKVVHDAQCPVWTNVHNDQPELAADPIPQTVVCGDRTDLGELAGDGVGGAVCRTGRRKPSIRSCHSHTRRTVAAPHRAETGSDGTGGAGECREPSEQGWRESTDLGCDRQNRESIL